MALYTGKDSMQNGIEWVQNQFGLGGEDRNIVPARDWILVTQLIGIHFADCTVPAHENIKQ